MKKYVKKNRWNIPVRLRAGKVTYGTPQLTNAD